MARLKLILNGLESYQVAGFGITNVGTSGFLTREIAPCFHFLIIRKEVKALTTPCSCARLLTDNDTDTNHDSVTAEAGELLTISKTSSDISSSESL
jgi:hypothetical protein